jgi:plasmid stability protein
MASITIRNLEDSVKSRLRVRAARHGRSMEDEARTILRAALIEKSSDSQNLVERIRTRFAPLGDVVLPQPPREDMGEPPEFLD